MNFVHCIQDFSSQHGLAASLFLGGFAGGFTHCVGMCAPFVLAQSGHVANDNHSILARLSGSLLIPYHLGRMTTYVFLAVVFYSFLNLVLLFSQARAIITAPILMLAAVLFLASVFPAFAKLFPWAARLHMPAPIRLIMRYSADLMNNPGFLKRYGLGILLGFMPCGLVVAALMAASTAPDITQTVFAMMAFALGTVPALIMVGFGGRALQMKFPDVSRIIRKGAMAVSAIWLFILAGWMMI